MITYLPHHFTPRPYQRAKFDAFFNKKYKRFVSVEHRRAGKDKTWFNITIAAAQQRVGTYLYMLPTLTQAKKVIWRGIDKSGFRVIDHAPRELCGQFNNTEMIIPFKNGSLIQLAGADNYNSYMGTNPVGIIFSEYSLTNPAAWDYFRPILLENEGWAAFVYTPRGNNHGAELFNIAQSYPDEWFSQLLTVKDTTDNEGKPILTEAMIEGERRQGMPEEMIEQEYMCSFTAGLVGSYFGKHMARAHDEKRILNFPIDNSYPVNTFWDFGTSDYTSIWFIQCLPHEYRVLNYYQNNGQDLQHYINYINDWRNKHGIVYQYHYSPHDGAKREFTSNQTIIQTAARLGINFIIVPRVPQKSEAINAARGILPRCTFHQANCVNGLNALKSYRQKWDEKKMMFLDEPVHDWSSHGADAFMQFAQSYNLYYLDQRAPTVLNNRVNQGKI